MGKEKMRKNGKWIVYNSKYDDTIIIAGTNFQKVAEQARKKGILFPLIKHIIMTDIRDYPFTKRKEYEQWLSKKAPYLPVRLTNPITNASIIFWGLIDNGASSCILPQRHAENIGIVIEEGIPISGPTAAGECTGSLCSCCLEILAIDSCGEANNAQTVITLPKGQFVFSLCAPIPLLGVKEFLKDYILTIDYPRQVFSIYKSK
jgi:hypothetical protein